MGNFTTWAYLEIERAGLFKPESDYGGMLGTALMKMVEVFDAEDHSGMSASIVRAAFHRLAGWEPLTPLAGDDSEWNEIRTGLYQNKRCSRVFKENGQAYDQEGRIFREPSGACFTSRDSRVNITFPYMPKSEYVDVPMEEQHES